MVSTPIFKINEALKEDMVNYFGATKAKTIYREKGAFLIDEPFLETEIFWGSYNIFKDGNSDIVNEMSDLLFDTSQEIKKLGGLMTEPHLEIYKLAPVMVWGIFGPKA
jgi:hypothetical protein